jgi:hypothetical protein
MIDYAKLQSIGPGNFDEAKSVHREFIRCAQRAVVGDVHEIYEALDNLRLWSRFLPTCRYLIEREATRMAYDIPTTIYKVEL